MEEGLERPVTAIGLMSGTSMDGVDAALLTTDGVRIVESGPALTVEYANGLRKRIRDLLGVRERSEELDAVEQEVTLVHAESVRKLLELAGLAAPDVRVIGFHGQTVTHAPEDGFTWQIGDATLLASETGIEVAYDFRSGDMANGGEGAPLAPVYHRALADGLEGPVAVLNIGGVANVTWIGEDGSLLAFDTGPGNALIDDWVMRHTGASSDFDGALARAGKPDEGLVSSFLAHGYFRRRPPKSLDRNAFDISALSGVSCNDGAATLTAFTAASVALAADQFPIRPRRWLVTGGGRLNPALMDALSVRLGMVVHPVEDAGWDGDALEAQAFAFMAVRALAGLPLSFPTTTGAVSPTPGGRLATPRG